MIQKGVRKVAQNESLEKSDTKLQVLKMIQKWGGKK